MKGWVKECVGNYWAGTLLPLHPQGSMAYFDREHSSHSASCTLRPSSPILRRLKMSPSLMDNPRGILTHAVGSLVDREGSRDRETSIGPYPVNS